jgi:hypothetical protein
MFHMYVNSSGQSSSWRLGSPCYVSFDDFFSCLFGFWGLSTQGRVIERCRQQKEGYFPSNVHLFFVRLTIKYSLISSSLNKKDINITMTPIKWRSILSRDIQIDMAPVRVKSESMRHLKVTLRKVRWRSKSTPASLGVNTSILDKAADLILASNQQISLYSITEGKEYGDDIENGGTTVT